MLGGIGCLVVWLVLEGLSAGVATGITESLGGANAAKVQLMLERLRRERPDAVVFSAHLDGDLRTPGGFRFIVADSTGITALRSPEREAWMVPWANVRSLTERFSAIRLDDGRAVPRLLTPTADVDELTARALIPPLIERMLAQRPAQHEPK